MEKTVVELFAGVGGFRVGLNHIESFNEDGRAIENNDYEFVWANQWEPSTKSQPAFECYCTRFGSENHSNISISDVNKTEIPNHNLLVGGFPCQDYSVARSLSGEKGITGKKGVLFLDIAEILEVKNPAFVLLENVDRLLKSPSTQRGRDFGIMLRTFDDKGYNVEWRVINAADYGARQRRRRTFIFAWRKDTKYNELLVNSKLNDIILKDGLFAHQFKVLDKETLDVNAINIGMDKFKDTVEMTDKFKMSFENSGCMIDGYVLTISTEPITKPSVPLVDTLQRNVNPKYELKESQKEKFAYLKGSKKILRNRPDGSEYFYTEGPVAYPEPLDKPSRTMLTSEGTVNRSTHVVADLDTGIKRLITPIEAERLQHFPDNWTNTGMTDRQRYFMMGNALVTFVISTIEPYLSEIIDNED